MKLSPKALGLSFGILWGAALCVITLLSVYANYLTGFAENFVEVYPYYDISLVGAFIGFAWGFLDGLIGGLIFGWVYNMFAPGSAN